MEERRLDRTEPDVVVDGQVGAHAQFLSDDGDTQLLRSAAVTYGYMRSLVQDFPSVRGILAGQYLDQGALAGAVLSTDCVNRSGIERQGDVRQGGDRTERLGNIVELKHGGPRLRCDVRSGVAWARSVGAELRDVSDVGSRDRQRLEIVRLVELGPSEELGGFVGDKGALFDRPVENGRGHYAALDVLDADGLAIAADDDHVVGLGTGGEAGCGDRLNRRVGERVV